MQKVYPYLSSFKLLGMFWLQIILKTSDVLTIMKPLFLTKHLHVPVNHREATDPVDYENWLLKVMLRLSQRKGILAQDTV